MTALLEVAGLRAGYAGGTVLHGVDLTVGQLSGGEQQMLAVARALLLNPRLLLLDEPSDGLAPSVVARVAGLLSDLRDQGLAILLVEQDLRTAFAVADEVAVMRKGEIAHRSPTLEFRRNAALASRLLRV